MAFCKYCGKELTNGLCDCPESVSASQGSAQQGRPAQVNQDIYRQGSPQGASQRQGSQGGAYQQDPQGTYYRQGPQGGAYQTGPQYQQAKETFHEVKTSFADFFRTPITVVNNAYHSASQGGQYAVAGVYAVAVVLFFLSLFENLIGTTEKGFATGFKLALGALAVKALYAAIVYFFAKRRDASVAFPKVLGVFCLVTIPETAMFVVLIVLLFIDIPSLFTLAMLATLLISVITPVIATLVVMQGDQNQTFLVSLLMQVVVVILIAVVARVVMNSILKDLSSGMFDMEDILDGMREMREEWRDLMRGFRMSEFY